MSLSNILIEFFNGWLGSGWYNFKVSALFPWLAEPLGLPFPSLAQFLTAWVVLSLIFLGAYIVYKVCDAILLFAGGWFDD